MKTVTYSYENIERLIMTLNSIEVRGMDNCQFLYMAGSILRSPIREGEENIIKKEQRKEVAVSDCKINEKCSGGTKNSVREVLQPDTLEKST